MGALPKNKITRAERGKRRQGNAPRLKRDVNVHQVAPEKRGLVARMMAALGVSKAVDSKSASK